MLEITTALGLPMDISITPTAALVVALYVGLAGAYLLVLPLITVFYLKSRWYVASSVERLLMYFAVFFFFPGLLLLSPFINFRPQRQGS